MSVPGPTLGPCTSWLTVDDIKACCKKAVGADPELLATLAVEASMALFEISGRQFSGLCTASARPCRDPCSCWGGGAAGLGPWYWLTAPVGSAVGAPGAAWGWWNECGGGRCGCEALSTVKLSGYPVREIVQVVIDGDVLPLLDDGGHPNYRLDSWDTLVRLDDPGPPVVPRRWPGCQNLALEPDQPGTFLVEYRYGIDPPPGGVRAAAQVACQLLLSCLSDGDCKLPTGATKVQRQGVTVERGILANWFDPTKATGLVAVDAFLASYWAGRGGRRAAVWSPDMPQYARRVT